MQGRLNQTPLANAIIKKYSNPNISIIEVNKNTFLDALNYFNSEKSKKNTLFDCIIAALAEKENADAIFSFDHFYKKKGFKLASEL